MVQSSAPDVDAFLEAAPPGRVAALRRIRALCRDHLPGWSETMRWGMPGYAPPGGEVAVSFNDQKRYIALYAGSAALDAQRATLRDADFGKSCVRFAHPDRIDFAAVAAILDHVHRHGRDDGC